MSAIASFYLVRNEDVTRLKDLATQPVGPSASGAWHDPYWEFLSANARELERYDWSGYVIGSEVYFYLQSRSADWVEYCDEPLSEWFCKARQSSIFIFRAGGAKLLTQLIESHWPDETALGAFLNSPDMTSAAYEVAPIEAVFDGLRILKTWLSQVDERHVGLLSIG